MCFSRLTAKKQHYFRFSHITEERDELFTIFSVSLDMEADLLYNYYNAYNQSQKEHPADPPGTDFEA